MAERPAHAPLFELALTRAATYLRARPAADASPEAIRRALEPWALKTRFASRVDLDALANALSERARAGTARDGAVAPDGDPAPGDGRG